MSRPGFLADHDLKDAVVQGVLRREPLVQFPKARELGLSRAPDPVVLSRAAALGLIVVTHDVTTMPAAAYSRLSSGQPMAGLFLVLQSTPIGVAVDDLVLVWAASEAEEWVNQVRYSPLK
jgi:hypothetical protein